MKMIWVGRAVKLFVVVVVGNKRKAIPNSIHVTVMNCLFNLKHCVVFQA